MIKKVDELDFYSELKLIYNSRKKKLVKPKKNKCFLTGRHRGFFQFFGLSRHSIKDLLSTNNIPGIRRSSW